MSSSSLSIKKEKQRDYVAMFSDQYEREKTPNMAASKKWSKSQPYGTDNEDERRAAV